MREKGEEKIDCLGDLGTPKQVEMDTEWEMEGNTRKGNKDMDEFLNMGDFGTPNHSFIWDLRRGVETSKQHGMDGFFQKNVKTSK